MELTTDEMKETYRKWKESTSTSPFGCHLGYWHALLAPDGDHKTSKKNNEQIVEQIWLIHTNTLNASILSGIPLRRWTTVHSNMLLKIEGVPQVDKLRAIHLYEADYNGYYKAGWPHRAVRHATKKKLSSWWILVLLLSLVYR
jgi:hypothetical protein